MKQNLQMTMEDEGSLSRPAKFTPDWPPRPSQKPLPNVFTKVSDKFTKVKWPPEDEEVQEKVFPQATVQLQDQMAINDDALFQANRPYKAAPTVYAEQPAELKEDVWPPPEPFDNSERVTHDASRPKRVIRDYTVFFQKNKAPETDKSYKVPPGTLHVISQRGVLSYDNVDIGAARMAEPDAPAT